MDATDVHEIAQQHQGLLARWDLLAQGATAGQARWGMQALRRELSGVSVTGWGPVTELQRWCAATISAPDTSLSLASAAAYWKMRPDRGLFTTVTRPGNRGLNRSGDLLVSYSKTVVANSIIIDGLRVTTPERTLIDLWPHLDGRDRSKMLREAIRLEVLTPASLLVATRAHRRRRGVALLRTELLAHLDLPFARCRSDAEAFGLVVLQEAGVPLPEVNRRYAGFEADFTWPNLGEIIELDGPQYHQFKEQDAIKTTAWTAAGFRVQRIGTDLLFADPRHLLLLAPPTPSRC